MTPLENLSQLQDFVDLYDFMEDDDLERAISAATKFIMKPDISPEKAQELMMRLQGYYVKFAMQAMIYTTIKKDKAGTPNNHRKNAYYTAAECIKDTIGTLKYIVRSGMYGA